MQVKSRPVSQSYVTSWAKTLSEPLSPRNPPQPIPRGTAAGGGRAVPSRAARARVTAGGGDSAAVVAVQSPAPSPARAGRQLRQGMRSGPDGRGGRRRGDVTSNMPLRLAPAVSMSVLSRSKKTARTRLSPIASAAQAAREPPPPPHRARARPAKSSWAESRGSPDSPETPGPLWNYREMLSIPEHVRAGGLRKTRRGSVL